MASIVGYMERSRTLCFEGLVAVEERIGSRFGVEDVDLNDALKKHHEGELRKYFFARSQDRNLHQFSQRTH